jgi:predicted esterase/catechol 2,3-dioxygenase-like lactoylglutathione lyase family enzyme
MMTRPKISGIHHITAVTSSAAENLAFYETTLGLRLVKQTVNFDDPYTYHLYYGDAQGAPGTILTFFPWENLPQGKPGAGMVTAIAFAVARASMNFWQQRLESAGIRIDRDERFGEPVIQFTDPHGLPLELIGTTHPPVSMYWQDGKLPEEQAITGFHSATATLYDLKPVAGLLQDVMGMTIIGQEQSRYRFAMDDSQAPCRYYDAVIDAQARPGRPGSGTIHHIAFRTENDATQANWQTILRRSGLAVTDVRDRKYFRSIYFRSPGGVLFEMATDPPGFSVDETLTGLGTSLKLPTEYEPMRTDIEKRLPPLRAEMFHHVFKDASGKFDDERTLVTLHGTGGNEYDLLGLAKKVHTSSAIISPRGRVSENGLPRFFKRLADNIFDQKDVVRRAHELSDFLVTTVPRYGRRVDRLVALGYSNGANIAAAVILLRPEIFSQAVLIRPMQPLENPALPDLRDKKILVLRGKRDRIIPSQSTDRLVTMLQTAGAVVTTRTIDAGHEITAEDFEAIRQWMSGQQACYPDCFEEAFLEETA